MVLFLKPIKGGGGRGWLDGILWLNVGPMLAHTLSQCWLLVGAHTLGQCWLLVGTYTLGQPYANEQKDVGPTSAATVGPTELHTLNQPWPNLEMLSG